MDLVKTISAGGVTRTTTVSSTLAIAYDSPIIGTLEAYVEVFRALVPVTLVRFKVDATDPNLYHYRINAVDGRSWVQNATFSGPTDKNPYLSWPNDLWRADEAILQRPIRQFVEQNMRVELGVTLVEIVYS